MCGEQEDDFGDAKMIRKSMISYMCTICRSLLADQQFFGGMNGVTYLFASLMRACEVFKSRMHATEH